MKYEYFKDGQKRYITMGIHQRLPPTIQFFLWRMVELMKQNFEADYLQVFNLEVIGDKEDDSLVQVITHSQEVPEYERIYYFPILSGITATGKIYIMDEGDHAIMLWADER